MWICCSDGENTKDLDMIFVDLPISSIYSSGKICPVDSGLPLKWEIRVTGRFAKRNKFGFYGQWRICADIRMKLSIGRLVGLVIRCWLICVSEWHFIDWFSFKSHSFQSIIIHSPFEYHCFKTIAFHCFGALKLPVPPKIFWLMYKQLFGGVKEIVETAFVSAHQYWHIIRKGLQDFDELGYSKIDGVFIHFIHVQIFVNKIWK